MDTTLVASAIMRRVGTHESADSLGLLSSHGKLTGSTRQYTQRSKVHLTLSHGGLVQLVLETMIAPRLPPAVLQLSSRPALCLAQSLFAPYQQIRCPPALQPHPPTSLRHPRSTLYIVRNLAPSASRGTRAAFICVQGVREDGHLGWSSSVLGQDGRRYATVTKRASALSVLLQPVVPW